MTKNYPRLPYMSCEIFCCEIPELLHYLAEDENDRLLHKLFTILDSSEPLDNYLAGYFEKILEMFFRRLTAPVMRLLNDESTSVQLLGKFLNHIDNYSVMQVVQRLLLPHIPFTMGSTDTGPAAAAASSIEPQPSEERDFLSCGWSYLPATCHQLCQRMLQPAANPDVPAHVSDLLITVLQLSPPDALFLAHLCEPECVSALVTAAFVAGSEEVVGLTETPSPTAAISLAAISVLESLVSKLCEGMGTADANGEGANPEQLALSQAVVSSSTESLVSLLIPSLPLISSQLKGLGEQAAQHTIFIQDKRSVPRLGHRGLQLVKLLESLVRIDVPAVDAAVISSGALLACIDLMFVFEMNSLLHLAVQRIVVMIIEGGAAKLPALEYLLKESNLLPRIISVVRSLDNKDQQQQQRAHTKLRSPVTGHLIHMAQTIHAIVSPSSAGKEGEEKTESGSYRYDISI